MVCGFWVTSHRIVLQSDFSHVFSAWGSLPLQIEYGLGRIHGGRHMKKILLASVAAAAFCAAPAFAADMPTKGPVYKATPAPVFSWSGCYLGANAGYLWAEKKWFDGPTGTYDVKNDPSGGLGGMQAGCNYQTGAWVFGIQGDYDWADASARNVAFPTSTFTVGQNLTSSVRDLASLTGRVGYSQDHFLGYVKGGVAWVSDKYKSINAAGVLLSTAKESRSGWTIGVGGEYAFAPNWSAFIEYDYYNFGKHLNTFNLLGGGVDFTENIRQRVDVVKVGLNYRFDWGKSPVVAKY
jgi:outer membrane immunogenic protein